MPAAPYRRGGGSRATTKTIPFMRGINPENIRGWIVNIYWAQAFGPLFKELASTAERLSGSANRK
jgi:hypothetical protein